MKRTIIVMAALMTAAVCLQGREYDAVPSAWKWLGPKDVIFTFDGTYTDSTAFAVDARTMDRRKGVSAPAKFAGFPVEPEGAVNLTFSPDSSRLAFTRDNDLYVVEIASGEETRLTFDGTPLIMNGYASWVYYEEIFGRPSRYRAFWWSPDSRRIGFYRFDNTEVPLFPIYSPFGQDGSINATRYPKAGEKNPLVRIGMVDVTSADRKIVWADFDEREDQYFGIPFWSADSESFYIAREPRVQNTIDLYKVSAADGSREAVYHETYPTWLDWPEQMEFGRDGLYMVRSFETGWEQIYYLSYDGRTFRRLTDGPNWRMSIVSVDEKAGDVYFTAERDSRTASALYRVDRKGRIQALTPSWLNVAKVSMSSDNRYFAARLSALRMPDKIVVCSVKEAAALLAKPSVTACPQDGRMPAEWRKHVVADLAGADYDPSSLSLPEMITYVTKDGFELPAWLAYPKDFDPSKKYPLHIYLYGGPNAPVVYDRWTYPSSYRFWTDNGIIHALVDTRAAGHNGRAGTDMLWRDVTSAPVADFAEWAEYFGSLPYVDAAKIGVEGFSFGGTMTTMLLLRHSDLFHYGIAGGGVYDWMLYDSHYTERFMDLPANNPEGYRKACALNYVDMYPARHSAAPSDVPSVMLRLTHGTGDDNVHFQNTLQLIDALQRKNARFEMMIYPDGMHGYRGAQAAHDGSEAGEFWLRHLLGK